MTTRKRLVVQQRFLPALDDDGRCTIKMANDSTVLGATEAPSRDGEYGIAVVLLENTYSRYVETEFMVKGITDRVELPEGWKWVGVVRSRSGYVWAVFQL